MIFRDAQFEASGVITQILTAPYGFIEADESVNDATHYVDVPARTILTAPRERVSVRYQQRTQWHRAQKAGAGRQVAQSPIGGCGPQLRQRLAAARAEWDQVSMAVHDSLAYFCQLVLYITRLTPLPPLVQ